jgi:hypothetical protein
MDSIEEIINTPLLRERFEESIKHGSMKRRLILATDSSGI